MQGWTLDEVRNLSATDYDEIIAWLRDEADRAEHPVDDSVDMDTLIAERRRLREDE